MTWEEIAKAVKRKDAELLSFEAGEMLKRVEKVGDLFAPVLTVRQKLGGKVATGGGKRGVRRKSK